MTHLDDAELVRHVDGEHATADEADRWRAHVDDCDRCAADIRTIRSRGRTLSAWLERADFEADLEPVIERHAAPRWAWTASGGAWLKAAAIVLLVAAPLAAFPGVRAWVADQVQRVTGGTAAVEDGGAAVTADGPVVRFATAAGRFTVRFEELPGAASLVLTRAPGDVAILRLAGDAEPVVAAGTLRIRGGPAGAVHRLALPAGVDAVNVLSSDEVIRVSADQLDRGYSVEVGR